MTNKNLEGLNYTITDYQEKSMERKGLKLCNYLSG